MKNTEQRGSNRGLWILLGGLGCIICILAVGLVVLKNNQLSGDEEGDLTQETTLFDNWGDYVANGDMDGLIRMTDSQIEFTDDEEAKSIIYASRAGVLYSFDVENESTKYGEQVLSDAYNAEKHNATGETAYLIYTYEQVYGDSAAAEEYLNIAEERGMTIPPGEG